MGGDRGPQRQIIGIHRPGCKNRVHLQEALERTPRRHSSFPTLPRPRRGVLLPAGRMPWARSGTPVNKRVLALARVAALVTAGVAGALVASPGGEYRGVFQPPPATP